MIKKLLSFKGIGKFKNYSLKPSSGWDGSLKKNTLIYGENGIGKSTLALIFQSLKCNDHLLRRKKSFNFSDNQEAKILIDGVQNPVFYDGSKWNIHIDDIEIFDTYFINNNIYTGLEIDSQHQKNLFEVILGSEGLSLKKEIQDIKEEIQTINKSKRENELKIRQLTQDKISVDFYVKLLHDVEIDKKINSKKLEIEVAKANEEIKNKNLLNEIEQITFNIDFQRLAKVIEFSIDSISQDTSVRLKIKEIDLSFWRRLRWPKFVELD